MSEFKLMHYLDKKTENEAVMAIMNDSWDCRDTANGSAVFTKERGKVIFAVDAPYARQFEYCRILARAIVDEHNHATCDIILGALGEQR